MRPFSLNSSLSRFQAISAERNVEKTYYYTLHKWNTIKVKFKYKMNRFNHNKNVAILNTYRFPDCAPKSCYYNEYNKVCIYYVNSMRVELFFEHNHDNYFKMTTANHNKHAFSGFCIKLIMCWGMLNIGIRDLVSN